MQKESVFIHWFRNDLRLKDNPALVAAAKRGTVLPIFIDDIMQKKDFRGAASSVWLHHSLSSLHGSLGGKLSLYRGDPMKILEEIIVRYDVKGVFWNRCYEPYSIHRDTKIKKKLKEQGLEVVSYNGSLLWEPSQVKKSDGTPYKVFTPFYRRGCLHLETPRTPLPSPSNIKLVYDKEKSLSIDQLKLLPEKNRWDRSLKACWDMGESAAAKQFALFLKKGLAHYKEGRNIPSKPYVSRMSPYLHFGEVSPNQLLHAALKQKSDENVDCFCSELGWREFSYSLLYYNPEMSEKNLQKKFDSFPWKKDTAALKAWQKGKTGVPLVDAGMRELEQTGYMHNRIRMVVASFLVKNLGIHWKEGAAHFFDTLVDADLASNSASWQWVAGCGVDAAPFFRIFNPVTQGKKFDPQGEYTRRFVPEIASLPDKHLFSPWEADEETLSECDIKLGDTYPHPIVDLKKSRASALQAFKIL
ncbi:MAG: Deoxyribodipyrimidine photo-lyase [Chlamydiia bacterium]|nr:Deoxyribodipyrimidine photo-lyase [Chlamydiia bacterium]MCH9618803.1 Deoxyribodipyrimidine photo-lyase [Chlamydiia bacterium]MCH9624604.1 Deoxyribodipyrimidine photo-lyase [Chlamydiia bacterium]